MLSVSCLTFCKLLAVYKQNYLTKLQIFFSPIDWSVCQRPPCMFYFRIKSFIFSHLKKEKKKKIACDSHMQMGILADH